MPDTELTKRLFEQITAACDSRECTDFCGSHCQAELDLIASALSAARAEAYEECAKECGAQAHVEECADDTMRGVENARPYRKMAKRFRALAAGQGGE